MPILYNSTSNELVLLVTLQNANVCKVTWSSSRTVFIALIVSNLILNLCPHWYCFPPKIHHLLQPDLQSHSFVALDLQEWGQGFQRISYSCLHVSHLHHHFVWHKQPTMQICTCLNMTVIYEIFGLINIFDFHLSFFSMSNYFSSLGPKGVITFTLLRVGLLWGEGPKAYASGCFNHNWGLLPISDLTNLLKDLMKKTSSPPSCVGNTLVTLLGQQKADDLAISENILLLMFCLHVTQYC